MLMSEFSESLLRPRILVDSIGRTYERPAPIDRLNGKLRVTADGCKEFSGYRNPHGYGQIGVFGSLYLAHRMMWIAHRGDIPDGLLVCHQCDNPPCCNIDHLFLGTPKENSADMVKKARVGRLLNEQHPRTRLSRADVAEIRRARSAGDSCADIAERFGVTAAHISRVIRGTRRSCA